MTQPSINRSMFRAYDIRGVVGEDLTAEVVHRIGLAIGTHLGEKGARTLALGHDVRPSSVEFHDAMSDALTSTGIDVLDIGLVPTPLMYFAVKRFGTDGGVVITASHNPPQFNGIKVRQGTLPLVAEGLLELADRAEAGGFRSGTGTVRREDAITPYIDTVTSKFRLARPLKVVLDGGNGCAGLVAPQVMEGIGCEVVPLFVEPDGTFPNHHPDPMKEANLASLKAKVAEVGANLGVAFDGDGDRLGIVDERGRLVSPTEFIALLSRQLLPSHTGAKVIFEVKVSRMLIEEVERLGGELVMTKVGYPFLIAAMKEHEGLLGGEMSGHFYFDDPDIDFDDGTFTAAILASTLASQPSSLATLVNDLPHYPSTPEISVHCPDEAKFDIVNRLTAEFIKDYDVITIDGARVLFDRGWGVVRASNTEPRLTLRFEAETDANLERIKQVFRQALEAMGLEATF